MAKLIKQGGGGYTIYLPKKWIDKNKLGKGNELSIEESGKNLIVSPDKIDKKTETEAKLINSIESSIRTIITNAYRSGYDKIKVYFNEEKQFNLLQKIVKSNLIGFEIIKKEKDFCIVENITEPSFDQFDNILKKLFLNIEGLFEITKNKLLSKEESEDFNEVEERILKYDNFCRRVITKQKLIKQNSEMFWTFLVLIIHGQRELYHLNKILDKKTKISKETINMLEGAFEVFKLIEEAYYKKDKEILGKIHELNKELVYKKAYHLMEKSKGKEAILLFHLTTCIRQFYLANSPLSGLLI